jgi:methyl-accepting chemotaxis protein
MFKPSRHKRALREIDAICGRTARGDMSGRVLHLKQYGDIAPLLVNFNRMLDLIDAYIRESGASLAVAAAGKYHRPFLPTGMVGDFQRGAGIINRARETMKGHAEETARLQNEVAGLVEAAAAGDMTGRLSLADKAGFMRQLAEGINMLVARTSDACTDVARVVGALAHGDLSQTIETEYQGLFNQLRTDVNQTVVKLRDIAGRLAESAGAVEDASGELSEGSRDLAARTESQAATLEETAAAMHEITATVKQNADNAQAANQLATAARDTAEKGSAVVADAVTAVTRIEASAQKIADIVGLIDEIAFQTNLLALNASVEAARAGESGKGFAVVAQEVRALAQRSANASKDIKTLIAESSQQVKMGVSLVNQTGRSLHEIVTAVKKASDIVAEIAAANGEQARGIEEVNTAVGNLDEMTQRNGALVEQTSASAQTLSGQAGQLTELVGFFRA